MFSGSSAGKESACNAGDPDWISGSGRSTGEGIGYPLLYSWASLVAQLVKNLPAMQKTWLQSLAWEGPLEKGMATQSCILAWRLPWGCMSWTQLSDFHFHTVKGFSIVSGTEIHFFFWNLLAFSQFNLVAQSCSTLCDPMDCSTPGFSVHHQLPELTQTHVHQAVDAVQPYDPLLSRSPTFNLSQHQDLFKWVSS